MAINLYHFSLKQWHTKTSQLPNSLVNNSIGHLLKSRLDNKIISDPADGINPTGVSQGNTWFRGKKPQVSFP
jgi:hypothetical protein